MRNLDRTAILFIYMLRGMLECLSSTLVINIVLRCIKLLIYPQVKEEYVKPCFLDDSKKQRVIVTVLKNIWGSREIRY